MGRPVDWGEVFGIADPTPGDPWQVRSVAGRWSRVADAAEYAGSRLRGLLGDDAVATWIGQGGNSFRTHSSELPDQLRKAEDSYRQASEAMSWWAGRLESHQADADAALVRGRAAKSDLESARRQLGSAGSEVSWAAGASALHFHGDAASSLAPTQAQVTAAQQRLAAAQQAEARAEGLVQDAQARLDAARQLAQEAGRLREQDGRSTAGKVHDAADAGIKPRSFWDRMGDALASAWHVLVTVAKVAVAVLGVVALIIGGPIAWVVLAAAVIVLADTLVKYAEGKAGLLDVGLAILGCIPGTKGLTSLAELSAAFKAGGMLAAGGHLLGTGKAAVLGMAQGVRALTGSLRTALVTFGAGAATRGRYVVVLARGFNAMVHSDFGLAGSVRRLPELLRVPMPRSGETVYRIYGGQLDRLANLMHQEGNADWTFGSGPFGGSWTPAHPSTAADFRSAAGLPDENPARFLHTGVLNDVRAVREVRLGLPLDGQPGGFPEYLIDDPATAVTTTGISGVNEPYTQQPGAWTPPPP